MEIYHRTLEAFVKEPKVPGGFKPAGAEADDAAHGLLSWHTEDGAELKLVAPEPSWELDDLGREIAIYGWLEDGTEVTLPGARVAGTHHGAISFVRLRDDRLLVGSNLDSEVPRFARANARFAHLHEWLPLTGISTPTRKFGEHGVERLGVEWEPPQTVEVALDGARLTLNVSMATETAHTPEHSIRTSLNASFKFRTPSGLRQLERAHLRPLQAFSTFAADRWDVPVYESVSDPSLDQSVRVLHRREPVQSRDWQPGDGRYLFLAEDCADVAQILKDWYRLWDKTGLPIAVFTDSLRNGNSYFPGRLIALVTSLEGYCDAVLSPGSNFFETFKRVRDHAGLDPVVTRCTDENLELLWRTRNHFTHLGARGGYSPAQLEDALLPSCRWGHALMQAALLHDLGFSQDDAEGLFKRHYANWPLP